MNMNGHYWQTNGIGIPIRNRRAGYRDRLLSAPDHLRIHDMLESAGSAPMNRLDRIDRLMKK